MVNSKTTLFIILIFLTSCIGLKVNNIQQGVYLSANDFSKGNISYTPIKGKKYKLRLNEFWGQPTLKVTIGDSVYKLRKDSIFGYFDKGIVYRFYENNFYQVLNPSEHILLYSKSFLGGYKNSQTVTNYYFSISASKPLIALTKWNLKVAFPSDTVFHELLDIYFTSNTQLTTFDRFYNTYKINRLYQISQTYTPYFKHP